MPNFKWTECSRFLAEFRERRQNINMELLMPGFGSLLTGCKSVLFIHNLWPYEAAFNNPRDKSKCPCNVELLPNFSVSISISHNSASLPAPITALSLLDLSQTALTNIAHSMTSTPHPSIWLWCELATVRIYMIFRSTASPSTDFTKPT